ncbi:hypothetical protein ACVIIV_002966 [Bradyrhizobium sp. USDA 4354]
MGGVLEPVANLLCIVLEKRLQVLQSFARCTFMLRCMRRSDGTRRGVLPAMTCMLSTHRQRWLIARLSSEDGLHSTLVARHVALDRLFQCRVASDTAGAIEILKQIETELQGGARA